MIYIENLYDTCRKSNASLAKKYMIGSTSRHRHQRINQLFDENFGWHIDEVRKNGDRHSITSALISPYRQ